MKKFLIIFLFLLFTGCTNSSKEDLYKIMDGNAHIIIDVRTEEEYEEMHVKDSINIPYDQINENISLEKDIIIFVYCKSGARSEIAFKKLSDLGYTVYDLGEFSKIDLPKEK